MYREEHIYVYVLYIYYINIYNRFGTICGFGHPGGSWNVALWVRRGLFYLVITVFGIHSTVLE